MLPRINFKINLTGWFRIIALRPKRWAFFIEDKPGAIARETVTRK